MHTNKVKYSCLNSYKNNRNQLENNTNKQCNHFIKKKWMKKKQVRRRKRYEFILKINCKQSYFLSFFS